VLSSSFDAINLEEDSGGGAAAGGAEDEALDFAAWPGLMADVVNVRPRPPPCCQCACVVVCAARLTKQYQRTTRSVYRFFHIGATRKGELAHSSCLSPSLGRMNMATLYLANGK